MDHQTPTDNSDSSQPQGPSPQLPRDSNPDQNSAQGPHDQSDLREMNSARTLTTVATIGGPVSLVIGGVALSAVALVCAVLALAKIRSVMAKADSPYRGYATMVRQAAIMGTVISAVALVLNIIGLIAMMPLLMEVIQTGDYSTIFGEGAANLPTDITAPSNGGNAWG